MAAKDKKRIKRQIEELPGPGQKHSVIHVMRSDAGWAVKREGAGRATRIFKTREEATEAAQKWVHESLPGELIIHHPDGTVQERHFFEKAKTD
ncbi:MAG TPA: DUF2188 domain-containing protein [Acidobacteriota bacterium]|nr:DUF2188 domain-containing protein [Acidobacteriota bacterium]